MGESVSEIISPVFMCAKALVCGWNTLNHDIETRRACQLSSTLNHEWYIMSIAQITMPFSIHFILMFQRLTELWFEIGEEENEVMVMADACLALCCKCLEMSLSFESLLRTLISSPLKVYIYSSLLVVEAPIRVGPS